MAETELWARCAVQAARLGHSTSELNVRWARSSWLVPEKVPTVQKADSSAWPEMMASTV